MTMILLGTKGKLFREFTVTQGVR